jgi:putative endonuclease
VRNLDTVWWLYIIRCRGGELYVGIAQDVKERVARHNKGLACRYTKYRRPVSLIYQEKCEDHRTACQRESEVKKFSRKKKLALMQK